MTAAPPADSGSTSVDAELGEIFQGAAETVLADESTESAAPETPPGEAPTPAPAPGTPAPEAPPGEGAPSYQLTEDGANYLVPKAELATFTGVKQYADAVQNRFPTANDAELGFLEATDFRDMRNDFLSGDDSDIQKMLGFWSGANHNNPQTKAQFQQSFARMATSMPDVLQKVNPEAHGKFVDSVIGSQIEAAYQVAAQTGDPIDLQRAQYLEWGATHKVRGEHDPATGVYKYDPKQVQAKQPDPNDARVQELDAREKAIFERDWNSFDKAYVNGSKGPKWSAFHAELDKTLAPIKKNYEDRGESPVVFEALRDRIQKDLLAELQKDTQWVSQHQGETQAIKIAYRQLHAKQQPTTSLKDRLQVYNNDFMSRVRRLLPSVAAPLLTKPGKPGAPQPKPPAAPSPGRAPNGQFAAPKSQAPQFYNVHEDPEFTSAFKIS